MNLSEKPTEIIIRDFLNGMEIFDEPPPLNGQRHRLETALRGGLEERQTEDFPVKMKGNIATQFLRVVGQDLRLMIERAGPTIEEILDNKDQNIKYKP